ncbi:hypothetical protein EDD37DRAFT_641288 [Exophiala viscosa]|uniref:uncharacterized protein n=1 Tax=Exophiala viscosa TaxID=2486360 RepID=UPI0021A06F26|nr:hypothetical protein EDD37DRAFT_641288 [Exophiala viscosa]
MVTFSVPPQGLALKHTSKHDAEDKQSKEPPQVIRLDLPGSVNKDIVRSLKNKEQVRLRCGKRQALQFGKKTIPLSSGVEDFPSEIFTRDAKDGGLLYFSGRSNHKLEVQKAAEDTAKSDEALAALENTLRSIQEQRASNETSIIGGREDLKHGAKKDHRPSPLLSQNSALRKDRLLSGMSISRPSSPFLAGAFSPGLGPTSTPLGQGLSPKDRVRLDAIRIPLIHLLAARPLTVKAIAEQLHAAKDDCEKLIDKVARDSKAGEGLKELKEKTYRELDVWKFPYRSQEDRQKAIDHAIQAYDRMRVEKKDNLWQLLLPTEDRGKGKVLSRLNFDKPVVVKPERAAEDGNESRAEMSDRETGKARVKTDTVVVQKKPKDKAAGSKAPAKSEIVGVGRSKDALQPKAAKPDGKFKSSERIEDSDEDADAADEVITKQKGKSTPQPISIVNKKHDQERVKTPRPSHEVSSPRKTVHKTSLSSSSSSGNEKVRSTLTNASKSLKPHQKPENSTSRVSPRPRHDSSPQKPSPLGSSPPTTSTDADNSSSSKASNQSSAPSSPPSDTEMPKRKQGNKYSPVVSDRSGNVSGGRSPEKVPVKRKAPANEEERPAKRQQSDSARLAPLPNGTGEHLKRPTPVRTDSERSTSPEKPVPSRQRVIDDARRFQKYYKRYKDLYDRISQIDEKDRDDKDMDDLWRMHKRLKEMKADIWNSWDRVEKPDIKVDKVREMVAV